LDKEGVAFRRLYADHLEPCDRLLVPIVRVVLHDERIWRDMIWRFPFSGIKTDRQPPVPMLSTHHHVHQGPSPKDGIVSSLRMRAMIRPCAACCAVSRNDLRSGSIRARRASFPDQALSEIDQSRIRSYFGVELHFALTNALIVSSEVF